MGTMLDFVEDPDSATFGDGDGMRDDIIIFRTRQQEQLSLIVLHRLLPGICSQVSVGEPVNTTFGGSGGMREYTTILSESW